MAWEYAEVQKTNLNMQNFGTLEHSNWIRQILWSQFFRAFLFLLLWKEATISAMMWGTVWVQSLYIQIHSTYG